MCEERSSRILVYSKTIDCFLARPHTLTRIKEDGKVIAIGYAEVTKGYSFEGKQKLDKFTDYLEDHSAVKYIKWFEDRLNKNNLKGRPVVTDQNQKYHYYKTPAAGTLCKKHSSIGSIDGKIIRETEAKANNELTKCEKCEKQITQQKV